MSRPRKHRPLDVNVRGIRIGEWVRVVSVPESVATMPRDTKCAFSRAVGKTFQIEAFNWIGCVELDLTGKVGLETILVEPFCVRRARRPRRYSLRFRKILSLRRKLDRPRLSFPYVAEYHPGSDPQKLVARLSPPWKLWHGWYFLENRGEIHGTFSAPDRRLSSRRQLEEWRAQLKATDSFKLVRVGSVRLRR